MKLGLSGEYFDREKINKPEKPPSNDYNQISFANKKPAPKNVVYFQSEDRFEGF